MNLDCTAGFLESLHLPFPRLNARAAGSVECFGGARLLLGVFTRLVSPALIFAMAVAYGTGANKALRAMFSNLHKFTAATPFLFLAASVIVFVFGLGKFSLDGWLLKKPTA